jgi:hypothetical protein
VPVADRVEGSEHIAREPARLVEHRLDHVLGKIAVQPLGQRRAETRGVLEREGDIGNRGAVGHRPVFRVRTRAVPGRPVQTCGRPPRRRHAPACIGEIDAG